jgi:hypothetical protein
MRKLFDPEPKKKIKKSTKRLKSIRAPPRYRRTYSEIYNMTEPELEKVINTGMLEEKDEAREILKKRKMERLVTYGY